MKNIQIQLSKLTAYKNQFYDASNDKDNKLGSFINLVLTTHEFEILMRMKKCLQNQGYEINLYCHDGLQIKGIIII